MLNIWNIKLKQRKKKKQQKTQNQTTKKKMQALVKRNYVTQKIFQAGVY